MISSQFQIVLSAKFQLNLPSRSRVQIRLSGRVAERFPLEMTQQNTLNRLNACSPMCGCSRVEEVMYDTQSNRASSVEARCHIEFLFRLLHFPRTTGTIANSI